MKYKVMGNNAMGWNVFRVDDDPDTPPVLVPHHVIKGKLEPYKHRSAAYRRAKQLNDALKNVDEMIERDGAIII